MLDRNGTTATPREISRQKEKDRSLYFCAPVMVPVIALAYFIVLSIRNGRDEFEPLRRFMREYEIALTVYMFVAVALVLYSLYVVVIKDVIEAFKQARTDKIMTTFAPMYRPRMTRGQAIAYWGIISASAALVILVAWLHLFR